jgi:putative hydrolase of the HAD superfamily
MKDFPEETGKMFLWEKVEAMPNAETALKQLSSHADCYIATNAKDSNKEDIEKALQRVGLDKYFKGVFCYCELGYLKPSKEYYRTIIQQLNVSTEALVMVGDNLDADIKGAQAVGIRAILYAPQQKYPEYLGERVDDLLQVNALLYA